MGKPKYIETPERLLDLFKQYVTHETENPMYKAMVSNMRDDGGIVRISSILITCVIL